MKKHMLRRFLSVFLCVFLCLPALSVPALAADGMAQYSADGETWEAADIFATVWNKAATDGGHVKLAGNVTASSGSFGTGVGFGLDGSTNKTGYLRVPANKKITLDLNGYTIDRKLTAATGTSAATAGWVIHIEKDATLTLNNTGDGENGKITGGYNQFSEVVYTTGPLAISSAYGGGGIFNEGTFTMNGGSISGNKFEITNGKAASFCGGGGVYSTGTFKMYGGSITDNLCRVVTPAGSTIQNLLDFGGGGVWCLEFFSMTDSEISRNTFIYENDDASVLKSAGVDKIGGGGIFAVKTVSMTNSKVSGNTCTIKAHNDLNIKDNGGGGVYCTDREAGIFTMTDSEISGNTVDSNKNGCGGGARVDTSSVGNSSMNGNSQIIGNKATYGGGLYIGSNYFIMNDGVISGNTAHVDVSGDGSGGGICFGVMGNFIMEAGSISKNIGGGVYAGANACTFRMEGGSITGNTSYGLWFRKSTSSSNDSNMILAGQVQISDNKRYADQETYRDIYETSMTIGSTVEYPTLKVKGSLTDGSVVNITVPFSTEIQKTSPRTIAIPSSYTITEDDVKAFASNDSSDGLVFGLVNGNIVVGLPVTVTLDPDGGTLPDSTQGTKSLLYGSPYGALPEPEKEGYIFGGWYTAQTGGTLVTAESVMQSDDHTLYARWTEPAPQTWTVTFESNGGSDVASAVVEDGTAVASPAAPTREGFTFNGWYTDTACTVPYDFTASVSANLTLYAGWTENIPQTWTVTFDSDGGTAVTPVQVGDGQSVTDLPTSPTKDGFTFGGWFTDKTYTTAFTAATAVTKNVTVYAKWTENSTPEPTKWTVTFDSDGGTAADPVQVGDGQPVAALPTPPTKDGFTFGGWFTDKTYATEFTAATVVTKNITVYAKWTETSTPEPTKWTVTFDSDGGTAVAPVQVVDGQSVTDLPTSTKDGFTFGGWFTDKTYTTAFTTATAVTANMTVYAKWTENSTPEPTVWTVTFDSDGGTAVAPVQVADGQSVTNLPTSTKDGYGFAGWFTDKTYTTEFTAATAVTKNVTVYAKFKPTEVTDQLDSIIKDTEATAEGIKNVLESIAKGDLKAAIETVGSASAIFDKIEELENRLGAGGSAEIRVESSLGFVKTDVKVTGAKLNFDYSKNVRLEVGQPENSNIQVPNQDTAETFRFSMKLFEGENKNVTQMDVPIRVTLPIPSRNLKPQTFKLWHFHDDGSREEVTLTRTPYQVDGQWYVSFMLSGFSDFAMAYEEEGSPVPPVSHTITFDTGDAPFTLPVQATGTDGRLPYLPAPTWGSRRFEGWFLADGTAVTTATVFDRDTTVYARWSHVSSAPETNFVSLPKAEHGKVITADRFAAEGERVNLSVHPDKGYALASITVTAGSKEITLRERGENKFSFTMPNRKVKVVAEFEKIQ